MENYKINFEKFNDKQINNMDMTTLLNEIIKKGIKINTSKINDKWFEFDSEKDLIIYNKLIKSKDKIFNA